MWYYYAADDNISIKINDRMYRGQIKSVHRYYHMGLNAVQYMGLFDNYRVDINGNIHGQFLLDDNPLYTRSLILIVPHSTTTYLCHGLSMVKDLKRI